MRLTHRLIDEILDSHEAKTVLTEAHRLAFDKGQTAASRISALQELLARPGDTNDMGVAIKSREGRSV